MERYEGQLIRKFDAEDTGNAAAGVSVNVYQQDGVTPAVLYATNSVSGPTKSQPMTTDTDGRFFFYAPNGIYWVVPLTGDDPIQIQLFDVTEFNPFQEIYVVGSQAEMLALDASGGALAIRTDIDQMFILVQEPASTLSNWQNLPITAGVSSWNGMAGAVTADYNNLPGESNAVLKNGIKFMGESGGGDPVSLAYVVSGGDAVILGDGDSNLLLEASMPPIWKGPTGDYELVVGADNIGTSETGANVYAGRGLLGELQFRKLVPGSGIGITEDSNGNILFNVAGAQRVISLNGLSGDLNLVGGDGVSITPDSLTGDIQIDVDSSNIIPVSANLAPIASITQDSLGGFRLVIQSETPITELREGTTINFIIPPEIDLTGAGDPIFVQIDGLGDNQLGPDPVNDTGTPCNLVNSGASYENNVLYRAVYSTSGVFHCMQVADFYASVSSIVYGITAGPGIVIDNSSPGHPVISAGDLVITDTFPVASEAAMLALTAQRGDVAVRTDIDTSFILAAEPASVLANWVELLSPGDVVSVNSKTGNVVLDYGDFAGTQFAVLNNGIAFRGRDTGNVARNLIFVTSSDIAAIGDSNIPLNIRSNGVPTASYGGNTHSLITTQGGQTINGALTTTGAVTIESESNPSLVQRRATANPVEHRLMNSIGGMDITLSNTAGFALQQTDASGAFEKNFIQGIRDAGLTFHYNGAEKLRTTDGGVEATGRVVINSGLPILELNDTDGTLDNKRWQLRGETNKLRIQALTDAGVGGGDAIDLNRSGTAFTTLDFIDNTNIWAQFDFPNKSVVLGNEVQIQGRETGGTARNLIRMNAANAVLVGQTTNSLQLSSSTVPTWSNGTDSRGLIHTGGGQFIGGTTTFNGDVSIPVLIDRPSANLVTFAMRNDVGGVYYQVEANGDWRLEQREADGSAQEIWMQAARNGGVSIRFDNTVKFRTVLNGCQSEDQFFWGGGVHKLFSNDGSGNSGITFGASANTSTEAGRPWRVSCSNDASGGTYEIQHAASSVAGSGETVTWQTSLLCGPNVRTGLFFNGTERFQTTNTGSAVLGSTLAVNGITYTWPGADGANGQVLTTSGSGTLTWQKPSISTTDGTTTVPLSSSITYASNFSLTDETGGAVTVRLKDNLHFGNSHTANVGGQAFLSADWDGTNTSVSLQHNGSDVLTVDEDGVSIPNGLDLRFETVTGGIYNHINSDSIGLNIFANAGQLLGLSGTNVSITSSDTLTLRNGLGFHKPFLVSNLDGDDTVTELQYNGTPVITYRGSSGTSQLSFFDATPVAQQTFDSSLTDTQRIAALEAIIAAYGLGVDTA